MPTLNAGASSDLPTVNAISPVMKTRIVGSGLKLIVFSPLNDVA
jgi:hypothetical protein